MTARHGIPFRHHAILLLVAGLLTAFIAWACVAELDEVVRGDGRVIPASEVRTVQSPDGGIIGDVAVREGETVQAGQVLARLRDVEAASDFSAARQKQLGLLAALARLRAAAEGTEPAFPPEVMEEAPAIAAAERDAFDADRAQAEGQAAVLREQRAQKEQEMTELGRKITDLSRILKLSERETAMVAPMVRKGASSKMELLRLERDVAEREAELNGLRLSLPRAAAALAEAERRILGLDDDFRARARRDLAQKTAELNSLEQTIVAYRDRRARTDIRSPVRGIVKDVRAAAAGGVVRAGDVIMEIVPLEDRLVVEGRIRPADIAFIHPGQKAVVRLSAFDFSVYGALEGIVEEVSADSISTDKGESFYRVRVVTGRTDVTKDGKTYAIIPGMQATIDILTGKRTVMAYLLKPFVKSARTAMTER